MIRAFHPRVAITSQAGNHIRYVPGAMADAMVQQGAATPEPSAGKVRSVALAVTAEKHAVRIGEASARTTLGVRFTRWVRLELSASRVLEHHPRCTYE